MIAENGDRSLETSYQATTLPHAKGLVVDQTKVVTVRS